MQHNFIRIGIGTPRVTIADPMKNAKEIRTLIHQAEEALVDVLVLPELSLTGYTCGDLFFQSALLTEAEAALEGLVAATCGLRPLVAVGLPVQVGRRLYNCAAVVSDGKLLGVVPKSFPETHWFSSGVVEMGTEITLASQTVPFKSDLLFACQDYPALTVGVEVGDSLQRALLLGPAVLINLAARAEQVGGATLRQNMAAAQSTRYMAACAYAYAGAGESTTDQVFSGQGIVTEAGQVLLATDRFRSDSHLAACDVDVAALQAMRRQCPVFRRQSDDEYDVIPFRLSAVTRPLQRAISPMPFLPDGSVERHCEEIFAIQTAGLRRRLEASGCKTAVIGVSGGLDSTLALFVTVHAFRQMGRPLTDIVAVTMPGFGTTDRTYEHACGLIRHLGLTYREIFIKAACRQHFQDIGHDPAVHDITYENAQARERTQILMDIANQTGGLVIGTGNLSEMALGWSTYGGDHISMYAVNCGIPKTVVQEMVRWLAACQKEDAELVVLLQGILDTPISPELLPGEGVGQQTEAIIGPYALHDFFLYHVVRYGTAPGKLVYLAQHAFSERFDRNEILKWLEVFYRRFFSQQFKRSCTPDGPQVGPISLSPRSGWQMPSDGVADGWLRELEMLKVDIPPQIC
ncbi:MAG: NAD(+) synthase [Oscillospiraceae bacterium]|nr:NAD(+) synthase [Oscillospiraceae bacterium]